MTDDIITDTITIKVSDLYDIAKLMKDDGMDVVEVSIFGEEEWDDDEIIPASLSLLATSKKQSFMSIDYGNIEAVQEEE